MVTLGLLIMRQGLAQIQGGQWANAQAPGSGNNAIAAGNAVFQQGLTQFLAGVVALLQRLAQLMQPDDGGGNDDGGDDDGGDGGGGGPHGARVGFSMNDLNAASAGLNALMDGMQADGGTLNEAAPAA
jgi:hypothetical protein